MCRLIHLRHKGLNSFTIAPYLMKNPSSHAETLRETIRPYKSLTYAESKPAFIYTIQVQPKTVSEKVECTKDDFTSLWHHLVLTLQTPKKACLIEGTKSSINTSKISIHIKVIIAVIFNLC